MIVFLLINIYNILILLFVYFYSTFYRLRTMPKGTSYGRKRTGVLHGVYFVKGKAMQIY